MLNTRQLTNFSFEQINAWRLMLGKQIYSIKSDIDIDFLGDIVQSYINKILFLRLRRQKQLRPIKYSSILLIMITTLVLLLSLEKQIINTTQVCLASCFQKISLEILVLHSGLLFANCIILKVHIRSQYSHLIYLVVFMKYSCSEVRYKGW